MTLVVKNDLLQFEPGWLIIYRDGSTGGCGGGGEHPPPPQLGSRPKLGVLGVEIFTKMRKKQKFCLKMREKS